MDEEVIEVQEEPKKKKKKERTITVQKGDDLLMLALKQLGSPLRYKEIMELNGLTSTRLYVGQELKLPEK